MKLSKISNTQIIITTLNSCFSMSDNQLVDERFKDIEEKDRPLVLLFGWAGANGKNLSKYSDVSMVC